MESKEMVMEIAKVLQEKRAQDIRAFSIGHLTVLADEMILCSGHSMVQVKSLAEHVDEKMSEFGIAPIRSEGMQEGRWIILDYGNVLVHIFHEQDREYYRLERLWADGTNEIVLPDFEEK